MSRVKVSLFTSHGFKVVDVEGNIIERTKESHPYSYDPYVIWTNNKKNNNCVYTDRLFQWDHKKYNELCKLHFGNKGQYWDMRKPKEIESFLKDWTGKDVELTKVMEYCNQASGYPVWRLDYLDLTT